MNRQNEYQFDQTIADIIRDNNITLTQDELDPVFGYLQTNSTLENLQYVLKNELLINPVLDERLADKPEICTALVEYTLAKIDEKFREQSWLSRKFSAFGSYLDSVLNSVFLSVYGFDGYDHSTQTVMTALGGEQPLSSNIETPIIDQPKPSHASRLGLYLASFFGLPSRPSGLNPTKNDQLDGDQLKRNFFGGWNPSNQITGKGYIIHSVLGDGDCGFNAIGVTRDEAINLLSTDENLNQVKDTLKQLFCEYLVEATNSDPFHKYLIEKKLLDPTVGQWEFINNREYHSHDNRLLKAFILFEFKVRRRWAHPSILQAVSQLLRSDLHIWILGDEGQLLPNYECAHYRDPENRSRKDILYVNNAHFERLELIAYPAKGPADDDAKILPAPVTWTAKQYIEWLLSPFKLLVIFPIKILLIIPKFLINVVKLGTEFIPKVASLLLNDAQKLLQKRRDDAFELSRLKDMGFSALISLCIFFSGFFTLWHLLGRAITSPLTSATRAYTFFREFEPLQIRIFGRGFQTGFATFLGVIFMLLSLAVSITVWTILLPFALSALAPYSATLLQTASTTFPTIAKALTTVSQLPVVSATLQAIGTAFTTVGSYLSSTVILSSTFSVISSVLTVQIPAGFIAAGVAMGTLLVPLATFSTWIADKLSGLWAKWGHYDLDSMKSMNDTKQEIAEFEARKAAASSRAKALVQKDSELSKQAASDAEFKAPVEEFTFDGLLGFTDLSNLKKDSNPLRDQGASDPELEARPEENTFG